MKSQLNLSQKENQKHLNDHRESNTKKIGINRETFCYFSHFKSFINLNSWGGFLSIGWREVKGLENVVGVLSYIISSQQTPVIFVSNSINKKISNQCLSKKKSTDFHFGDCLFFYKISTFLLLLCFDIFHNIKS